MSGGHGNLIAPAACMKQEKEKKCNYDAFGKVHHTQPMLFMQQVAFIDIYALFITANMLHCIMHALDCREQESSCIFYNSFTNRVCAI